MSEDLKKLEYPRHVHFPSIPGDPQSRIVQNAEECAQAIKDGGSLVPVVKGEEKGAKKVAIDEPEPQPVYVVPEPEKKSEPPPPPPPVKPPPEPHRGQGKR